mmetsp:Transcript_48/g.37  ORF Transcript_48/g.37 Transcript_48/m.37 type:complete len:441 (-) Transcript_48:144-1466(-)|eukprot:CAMPEP_0184036878 /NCGR_PEP_ID=MMETSP0955-20130417/35147_1 /TAXON_ID=627963 /ORGANISM="Aplanochytrium sp, Strain PBS07" /LENGTH=440 /DNA_ID=CAMNT_0026324703 /DNA_START=478 /DNA_END=1800 /DNA_ORIENTATION=-
MASQNATSSSNDAMCQKNVSPPTGTDNSSTNTCVAGCCRCCTMLNSAFKSFFFYYCLIGIFLFAGEFYTWYAFNKSIIDDGTSLENIVEITQSRHNHTDAYDDKDGYYPGVLSYRNFYLASDLGEVRTNYELFGTDCTSGDGFVRLEFLPNSNFRLHHKNVPLHCVLSLDLNVESCAFASVPSDKTRELNWRAYRTNDMEPIDIKKELLNGTTTFRDVQLQAVGRNASIMRTIDICTFTVGQRLLGFNLNTNLTLFELRFEPREEDEFIGITEEKEVNAVNDLFGRFVSILVNSLFFGMTVSVSLISINNFRTVLSLSFLLLFVQIGETDEDEITYEVNQQNVCDRHQDKFQFRFSRIAPFFDLLYNGTNIVLNIWWFRTSLDTIQVSTSLALASLEIVFKVYEVYLWKKFGKTHDNCPYHHLTESKTNDFEKTNQMVET